jgi:hypothetical protein
MKFLPLIFLFPLFAEAQYKGLDLLGLAMQDCPMIAETITNKTAIGVLEGTFGDPMPCLERLISTGKVSSFRVHLINGPCWRNHDCAADEPSPLDSEALETLAARWQEFADRHKNVACFISPVLEHDIKDRKKVTEIFNLVKLKAPRCTVVQSIVSGEHAADVMEECHGNNANCYITSNDGESLFDADAADYKKSGKAITFGWIHSFNLRDKFERKFTMPKQRRLRASKEEIIRVMSLLDL